MKVYYYGDVRTRYEVVLVKRLPTDDPDGGEVLVRPLDGTPPFPAKYIELTPVSDMTFRNTGNLLSR